MCLKPMENLKISMVEKMNFGGICQQELMPGICVKYQGFVDERRQEGLRLVDFLFLGHGP